MDSIAGFERIMRTPMPLAYSIHLQVSVWIYLLSLPFQVITDVGPWWQIPITGLASACFLGILAVGFEIENPFGYDANDLVSQIIADNRFTFQCIFTEFYLILFTFFLVF